MLFMKWKALDIVEMRGTISSLQHIAYPTQVKKVPRDTILQVKVWQWERMWHYNALVGNPTDQWTSIKQYEAMPTEDLHSTATTARLFNWRTGIYFNVWFVTGGRRRTHPILYLCSHRYKRLLDVGCTFCTCFKEWDAQLVGILL